MCVPTPLDRHFEPDLSYVVDTIEAILPHVRPGQVISLESTTYPGTTDEELVNQIACRGISSWKRRLRRLFAEREDPGNPQYARDQHSKGGRGTTAACGVEGVALYGAVFDKVVPVSSTRVAELTKLLENIYRSVNIGLVNELKIVSDRMESIYGRSLQRLPPSPLDTVPSIQGQAWAAIAFR